ncbi:MAG: GNAT family N-acetyltransferase [Deltaproteobacteria bacterium]|nr:GNAT family N-acetyltransferase [Deltaproteobacteria bacterium]
MKTSIEVKVYRNLDEIETAWNQLTTPNDPFFDSSFLKLLQDSKSIGSEKGWDPYYFTLESSGEMLAAVPVYLKTDSYGEYVFDWEWARAYQQLGLSYYPKAVVAVPFTPVNGSRILLKDPLSNSFQMLLEALLDWVQSQKLSSLHFLFCTEEEQLQLQTMGFIPRLHYQFHWVNQSYQSFDHYLSDLHHKKRNQIKSERRKVQSLGLKISCFAGSEIHSDHLAALWSFSQNTFLTKSGTDPYLTESFFMQAALHLKDQLFLVMAEDHGKWVAGSLNFVKGDILYGRYWGANKNYPYLHFECCYYQLIEYAIAHHLKKIEAGAQGEQKFLRGFDPAYTYSAHWIADERMRKAIASFCKQESQWIEKTVQAYREISPLKRSEKM